MNRPDAHRLRTLAAAAMLCIASGGAAAAQFSMNPTRVELDAGKAVATLNLTNTDASALDFEVSVMAWRQDADGQWVQVPSKDLIVHPQLLRVAPGATAALRVGTLQQAGAAESAYRIELQQLPDARARTGAQLSMLTRISVPVFLRVAGPVQAATAHAPRIEGSRLSWQLGNAGTTYLAPQAATLRLRDGEGRVLHEQQVQTGYVLVGARLPLQAAVPARACQQAARLELQLEEIATPVVATVPADARRCAP